jgi:hypothetical protein
MDFNRFHTHTNQEMGERMLFLLHAHFQGSSLLRTALLMSCSLCCQIYHAQYMPVTLADNLLCLQLHMVCSQFFFALLRFHLTHPYIIKPMRVLDIYLLYNFRNKHQTSWDHVNCFKSTFHNTYQNYTTCKQNSEILYYTHHVQWERCLFNLEQPTQI